MIHQIRALRVLTVAAGSLVLAGCMALYQPPADAPTTEINVKNVTSPSLCVNGTRYSVKPDEAGYVKVATGDRITLYSFVYQDAYVVAYSCTAGISFVPHSATKYYADSELRESGCSIGIFREGGDNPAGLSLEPTARAPFCRPSK